MAGLIPHLGLPVRGPIRQHALCKSKVSPGPEGPLPTLRARFGDPLGAEGKVENLEWLVSHDGEHVLGHPNPFLGWGYGS